MAGSLRKAGLTILVGSAGGMAVTLIATPLLSRLYSPAEFGLFSSVLAISAMFIGFASQRMEILAQAEETPARRSAMIRLGIILVTICSSIISTVTIILAITGVIPAFWTLVGLMVFAGSLAPMGTATLVMRKDYGKVAYRNFSQQSSTAISQTIFGALGAGPVGLALGFIVGRLTWTRSVFIQLKEPSAQLKPVWRAKRGAAAYAGGSALVNSISGQLLPVMMILLFGPAAAGLVAMALRVSVTPINVVGQAVASAAAGEVGAALRSGNPGHARKIVKSGMREQFLIGLVPAALVAIFAQFVVGPVLGDEWLAVGPAISLLMIGGLFQFVASPFSQVLNITGNNRGLLYWDIARMACFTAGLAMPAALGWSWLAAVACYSALQVPLYIVMITLILGSVRHRQGPASDAHQFGPTT